MRTARKSFPTRAALFFHRAGATLPASLRLRLFTRGRLKAGIVAETRGEQLENWMAEESQAINVSCVLNEF